MPDVLDRLAVAADVVVASHRLELGTASSAALPIRMA
jgi:hypothetical protein